MCKICGRNSCVPSFHSFEEQDRFDLKQKMSEDVDKLREEILSLEERINDLQNELYNHGDHIIRVKKIN